MAGKNDRWVMFRNYMHNELGITKEDIREWIADAIKDQVKEVVHNTYESCDIEDMIRRSVLKEYDSSYGNTSLKSKVAQIIANRIELNIKA